MLTILQANTSVMLTTVERGHLETYRNQILLRFETKQLEIFNPKDPGHNFDANDHFDNNP